MPAPTRGGWVRQTGSSASVPPVVDLTAIPNGSWMIGVLIIGTDVQPNAHPAGWRNPWSNPSQLAGTRRVALAYRTKQAGDTSLSWTSATNAYVSLFVLHGTGAAPDTTARITSPVGVRNAANVVAGQSVQAGTSATSVAPAVTVTAADSLVVSLLMEATAATGAFALTSGASPWFESPEQVNWIEAVVAGYSTPGTGATGAVTATATATQANNGLGVQIVLPAAAVEPPATLPGFSSVAQMLATPGATWAHRGGSTNWPEMSEYAYDQAVLAGYGALEFSAHRTSDGVWIGSHDPSLNRTSQTSGLPNISAMTWAQVQTYMNSLTSAGTPRPYYRLDDFLDKYTPTHVCIVDPKNDVSRIAEFLAICDAHGGNTKIVVKFFGVGSGSTALADAAAAKGYQTWGYFYEADVADGDLAADQSHWSILGMEYGATQASWDAVLSYGKPVVGHIAASQANYDTAIAKGARMVQCANVAGIRAVGASKIVTQTLPALTSASAGTSSPPLFAGTVAAGLSALSQSATGATTPPSFTAAVAASTPAMAAAATGVVEPPLFSGAMTSALHGLASNAAGVTAPPVQEGVVASALPPLNSAATGAVVPPAVVAVVSVTLPPLATVALGAVGDPTGVVGSIAQTLPTLSSAAVGGATRPGSRMVLTPTTHRPGAVKVRPRPLSPPAWPPA